MTRLTTALPQGAETVAEWLRGGGADTNNVRVVDVALMLDEDAEGEPILRFLVTLEDPLGETWPVRDVLELHRRTDDRARSVAVEVPWHVSLQAQTQDEWEPDDVPTP